MSTYERLFTILLEESTAFASDDVNAPGRAVRCELLSSLGKSCSLACTSTDELAMFSAVGESFFYKAAAAKLGRPLPLTAPTIIFHWVTLPAADWRRLGEAFATGCATRKESL